MPIGIPFIKNPYIIPTNYIENIILMTYMYLEITNGPNKDKKEIKKVKF